PDLLPASNEQIELNLEQAACAHQGDGPGHGAVHRMVRNSTFNLAAQGLYAVFYLVVVCILARILGKDLLGEYFFQFALILVVQLVVEAGVGTVLTCRIAQAPAGWKTIAQEGAGLFVVISMVSVLAFVILGAVWAGVRGQGELFSSFVASGFACAAMQ